MRILHVLDHSLPLQSGYTFRTLAILREQRALGWETVHLTSPKHYGTREREEDVDGWHFFRTPTEDSWLGGVPLAREARQMQRTARRLDEIVRATRPDVIHAHSPVLNAIPALRVGRQYGIPVVYEVRAFWEDAAVDHGSTREGSLRYRATRALETWAAKRADAVTVICEGLREDLIARGLPMQKITVIPNAVDVDQFMPSGTPNAELKRKLGLGEARILGFIGSFYAYEGIDLLLRALPQILNGCPEVKVLLTGGGPQDAQLRALAAELNVQDRVVFTGRVPHGEVAAYYDLIDVLVYARHSMRLTELVTPLKPLEAMAQGRLMVASDVGGHKELIRDGKTGVLFRADDAGDLAAKVLSLLGRPEDWAAMRQRARAFVESERTWSTSVARYRPVYEALTRQAKELCIA